MTNHALPRQTCLSLSSRARGVCPLNPERVTSPKHLAGPGLVTMQQCKARFRIMHATECSPNKACSLEQHSNCHLHKQKQHASSIASTSIPALAASFRARTWQGQRPTKHLCTYQGQQQQAHIPPPQGCYMICYKSHLQYICRLHQP
jgi:hypothetical protein